MPYSDYLDIGLDRGLLSYPQYIGLYTEISARFQKQVRGLRIKYFK